LARDLSEAKANLTSAGIVVVSTLVYALAAITVAARIFGAEAVLFSEQQGWSDMVRRPAQPQSTATVSGALLCLALLFPASFIIVSMLPQAADTRLASQVLATFLTFAGMPILACWWGRIRFVSGFQLAPPPWTAWPAALALAAAAVPAILQLVMLMLQWKLTFLNYQLEQQIRIMVRGWRAAYTAPVLIGLAAAIGVAEELFFRGFLFSALRSRASRQVTIVGSAVLFGLFHFVNNADQLIPSTLMGLMLGWMCWQTRSVLPCIFLHASYNAMLFGLMYYQFEQSLSRLGPEVPVWWQIAAFPLAAAGVILLWRLGPANAAETAGHVEHEALCETPR
jgi:sodium transport system permease protein